MASFNCRIALCVVILVATGLSCNGQMFHVKHGPPYVSIQSQSPDIPVYSSDLHNILSGPLGLNNKHEPIIQSKSMLKRPKANILFTIVTDKDHDLPVESVASFPLVWDVPFVDVEQLMNNLQSKFLDKDPVMLDVQSSNRFFDVKTSSSIFQSLPSSFDTVHNRFLNSDSTFINRLAEFSGETSLNSSFPSDAELLAEMQMVHDVISILKGKAQNLNTKIPDLLSFTLTSLPGVVKEHGVNSEQAKDAQDILTKHLNQITEDLKSLYKGNVMIEVLTVPHVDVVKVRKTRSLMEAEASSNFDWRALNLELEWYGDFPAIFNIILWLMIILLITIFFVAYGIWNLNPNLESILYRVPQDDLKKNN